jgi:hypothetical protein
VDNNLTQADAESIAKNLIDNGQLNGILTIRLTNGANANNISILFSDIFDMLQNIKGWTVD